MRKACAIIGDVSPACGTIGTVQLLRYSGDGALNDIDIRRTAGVIMPGNIAARLDHQFCAGGKHLAAKASPLGAKIDRSKHGFGHILRHHLAGRHRTILQLVGRDISPAWQKRVKAAKAKAARYSISFMRSSPFQSRAGVMIGHAQLQPRH